MKHYFASGSLPSNNRPIFPPSVDLKPTSAMGSRVVDDGKNMFTKKSGD